MRQKSWFIPTSGEQRRKIEFSLLQAADENRISFSVGFFSSSEIQMIL